MTVPHGTIHWTELMTHDSDKARDFYNKTLGWTFESMPMGEAPYWIVMSGDEMVGGMFTMAGAEFANVPEHWMTYIAVDDVDARIEKAKANGGTVLREPFEVPTVGRIAMVQAPGGAVTGWMTPAEAPDAG